MHVIFSRTFSKSYEKLDSKIQHAFEKRMRIFVTNEFDHILRNHTLKGKYKTIRSITITGDFRAHYTTHENDVRYFVTIGSHSELYVK